MISLCPGAPQRELCFPEACYGNLGPKFEELTDACEEAGLSGSDWNELVKLIETRFKFTPTEKQLNTMQRQLNDRAGK